jgi:hypothetical protein
VSLKLVPEKLGARVLSVRLLQRFATFTSNDTLLVKIPATSLALLLGAPQAELKRTLKARINIPNDIRLPLKELFVLVKELYLREIVARSAPSFFWNMEEPSRAWF